MGLRAFLTNRRWLILLAGTAGTWFLLDYAYYGNTISTPQILSLISPTASTMTKIALQLAIFVVAAVPGYVLAIATLDKIGHRRLQLTGFAMMALCFLIIAAVPGLTTTVAPFLIVYGVSYFFTEFGPNMTTFVMPSELYPVTMRATGHGISAGIGKLGAFIGVFLFPVLQSSLGLRGTLLLTAGVSRARARPHPGAARASRAQPGRHLRSRRREVSRPARTGRGRQPGHRHGRLTRSTRRTPANAQRERRCESSNIGSPPKGPRAGQPPRRPGVRPGRGCDWLPRIRWAELRQRFGLAGQPSVVFVHCPPAGARALVTWA